jgi:outer membrane protein
MKRISLLAASFVLSVIAAGSAFSQAPAQTGGKIGWLDTGAFADEKAGGITKYINALKALELEMKPRVTELQGIQTKMKTISDDLTKMQSNPAIPIDQKAFAAKQEEGQRLQREGEFKKKEYDASLESRSQALLGPIQNDISKAIQEYAKARGYTVILDIDKLGQAGIILALDGTADVTKDFVTFYNARPGSTATTATPK